SRGPAMSSLQNVRRDLKKLGIDASIQLFSAVNRTGLEDAAMQLATWLDMNYEESAKPEVNEDA
ncbi:MAG: YihA family ribosome biogenesis GTP-binding protein, partial [Moraxellaceae bacterium]|nr:YihA family ribosome biogenesis GTP-binding protein [Moraxellaceae bacterium]